MVAVSLVFAGAVTISAGLVSGSVACGGGRLARLRGRLVDCLGCIGHRRGGIHLEVADAGRRNVRRLGAGDCGVDREFSGAGAGRIRRARQGRGRGNREERCRDSHQHAVKASTVRRTVTHRHTPLGELPRHGTVVRYRSSQLAREAPASSGSVGTPAHNDLNADDTCAPFMQPAPCGTTHDKLTSNNPLAFGSAVLPRHPPFVCHLQATVQRF